MIALDCNAAIAAFQTNPQASSAVHRARVRHFLRQNSGLRLMFPAVALSEYLWGAERDGLEEAIQATIAQRLFAPAFDEGTAAIAANLGRRYVEERKKQKDVVRVGQDRVAMRADLLIVATALQNHARFLLTNDEGCFRVAKFAAETAPAVRIEPILCQLPDPPVPVPPPASVPQPGRQGTLFDLEDN